ncbi:membrane protein DedA with SNARE-associated domain [Crossiella equi]|uniref:Membrane protein DedA with SNARE-associated domain n=1 Tax=Crossiella equi TaxID=130796 RepID=A0ABS5AL35_9PSEU|nr:hypothetical protein [Crossiella equi]MBP2477290.1 membrane protein DedA with SNARE-associated domain [Crossiella equi]
MVLKDYVWVILLGLAGFLLGGVYVTWKTSRMFSFVLLAGAVLAAAGAVTWML